MATIPQLTVRPVRPNVGMPVRTEVPNIAGVGDSIAADINEFFDAKDEYQYNKASSAATIAKIQTDREFENDKDYGTLAERWRKSLDEKMGPIVGGIHNPQSRARFQSQIQPRIEDGHARAMGRADALEKDYERGSTNTILNDLRDGGLKSSDPADRVQVTINAQKQIDAAIKRGWYSEEEGAELRTRWNVDYAKGIVRMAAPADRFKLLNDPLVKNNLPPDDHAVLLREAEEAQIEQRAFDLVDAMRKKGTSLTDAMSAFQQYDAPMRKALENRFQSLAADDRSARMQAAEDLHQDWYLPVLNQDKGFDTQSLMGNPDFRNLPVQYQKDLLAAAGAAKAPRTKSDIEVIDKLEGLYADKDYAGLRDFFVKNVNALSSADQSKWSHASHEGRVADPLKSELDATTRVKNRIQALTQGSGNRTVSMSRHVMDKIDQHRKQFIETTGKPPDTKMEDSWIDRELAEVVINPGTMSLFQEEDRYYLLDADRRKELRNNTLNTAISKPAEVKDAQLNIVLSEVFEGRDLQEVAKAHATAVYNVDRLSDAVKKQTVQSMWDTSPALLEGMMGRLEQRLGRPPALEEVLGSYRAYLDKKKAGSK